MAGDTFPAWDETNFDEAVLARDGLTVVDFWSSTCVPCKALARVLEQLADDLPEGVAIGTVDGDKNPGLLARFGVRGFPTLLFFRDGRVVETRTGVDRRQVLKQAIAAHA